jgi:hypothetical protein
LVGEFRAWGAGFGQVDIPSVAVPALPLIEADCADPPVSLKLDLPVEGSGFRV